MRKACIPELIYQKTFPKPKQGDPVSFYAHIQKHIVGEVRIEVQSFFGALDTLEAQYPGLDYSFPPHRRRLVRYTWHRRLFRVFDELGLTADEILNLCQWEGTRAAKERYEREAGVEIRTTTADEIVAAPPGNGPRAAFEDLSRPASADTTSSANDTLIVTTEKEQHSKDTDSMAQVPVDQLWNMLRSAMASRMAGDSAEDSQAWDDWLKQTLESHDEVDVDLMMQTIRHLEPETFGSLQEDPEAFSGSSTPQSRTEYQDPATPDTVESGRARGIARTPAMGQFLQRTRTEAAM